MGESHDRPLPRTSPIARSPNASANTASVVPVAARDCDMSCAPTVATAAKQMPIAATEAP